MPDKPKILIFAFEPFADGVNISEDVLKNLDIHDSQAEIETLVLPVDIEKLEEQFHQITDTFNPDYIICLGERNLKKKVDTPSIEIEKFGRTYTLEASAGQGKKYLLEHEKLTSDTSILITAQNITPQDTTLCGLFSLSTSAGAGACNRLYFLSLEHMKNQRKSGKAAFLHLEDNVCAAQSLEELAAFCEDAADNNLVLPTVYQTAEQEKERYNKLINQYVEGVEHFANIVIADLQKNTVVSSPKNKTPTTIQSTKF